MESSGGRCARMCASHPIAHPAASPAPVHARQIESTDPRSAAVKSGCGCACSPVLIRISSAALGPTAAPANRPAKAPAGRRPRRRPGVRCSRDHPVNPAARHRPAANSTTGVSPRSSYANQAAQPNPLKPQA